MTIGLQIRQVIISHHKVILRHVLCWILFALYEIGFVYGTTSHYGHIPNYLLYYSLNICLFYSNACLALPLAFKQPRRRYGLAVLLILLELLSYLLVKYGVDALREPGKHTLREQMTNINQYFFVNLWRGLYFVGLSTFYWFFLREISFRKQAGEKEIQQLITQKENTELEKNLAEARNAHLQHQINPHLLFNTLTFIHNTYYQYSKEAAECVILLSDIMRYALKEADGAGKVSLSEEIEQVRNLIEINQIRLNGELQLDFQAGGDFGSYRIIPLILLTLTENMIKHGHLKKKTPVARLHIVIDGGGTLTFSSWNWKSRPSGRKRLRSQGIQNVIKRLEHSYKNLYQLNIKEEDESYGLELTMKL